MSVAAEPSMRAATGRAPGKVIVLGEHAVVYGRTAIAASIARHVIVRVRPRRDGPARATAFAPRTVQALERAGLLLDVDVTALVADIASDLPAAVGLGSSAAFSVALLRALAASAGRVLDDTAVCAAALEIEKLFHGFPSGVDTSVATYGGLIAFRRGTVTRPAPARRLSVVIAVGTAPRRTQTLVTGLRARRDRDGARHDAIFDALDALTREGLTAITAGDAATLGRLMRCAHELLRELRVSTPELDAMVALADAHGGLGAKLTGAGGGGAVLCLPADDGRALVDAFARAGWRAFTSDIGPTREEFHADGLTSDCGSAAR